MLEYPVTWQWSEWRLKHQWFMFSSHISIAAKILDFKRLVFIQLTTFNNYCQKILELSSVRMLYLWRFLLHKLLYLPDMAWAQLLQTPTEIFYCKFTLTASFVIMNNTIEINCYCHCIFNVWHDEIPNHPSESIYWSDYIRDSAQKIKDITLGTNAILRRGFTFY